MKLRYNQDLKGVEEGGREPRFTQFLKRAGSAWFPRHSLGGVCRLSDSLRVIESGPL